ncbi:hypothetical protein [Buchananella hordeovulneris]|uniref:hypothetical protein n=1 Tax=Buchananella hordeovulneris TaxID=52770 RepID=UPI000F5EF5F9|nr:hypothetical protein [Buchananella hordeovulneris]RRD43318.1 hypothetical protein EII13_07420 [Buchananella hordeovulneris]
MTLGYPPQKKSRSWVTILVTVLVAGLAAVAGYFASSHLFGGEKSTESRPAASATASAAATDPAAPQTQEATPADEATADAPAAAGGQVAGDLELGADNVVSNARMEVKFPAQPTVQEVGAGEQQLKFWAVIHEGKQYYAAYVPQRTPGITLDSSIMGAMQNSGSTLKNTEDWLMPGVEAKIGHGESPAGPVTFITALAVDAPDQFMVWQVGGEMDHEFFTSFKVK